MKNSARMRNEIQKRLSNLPTKPEDLQKWMIVEAAKLAAKMKALSKVSEAIIGAAAYRGALKSTQDTAEYLLYAEARFGATLEAIPEKKASSGGGTCSLPAGITKRQSHYAQELSRHEDAIAETVATAREKGEVPVRNQVMKTIQTNKREAERAKVAKSGKNASASNRWSVEIGDIRTYQTEKKFDFIITDPPYPKEYLELYGILAKRANEWLKPGGLVIAMCGQSYLDQIYSMMSKYLDYYWTACYLTPGQPKPLRQKQVNTTWKPLLLFTRQGDRYKGKIFGDVFKSEANDKDMHKWGQSESGMLSIISSVCLPGQSIFDPFCGASTTGVAALKQNCLFQGIDSDKECVLLSRGRLNDETT